MKMRSAVWVTLCLSRSGYFGMKYIKFVLIVNSMMPAINAA